MIDYKKIIDSLYPEEDKLKEILVVHSTAVAEKAKAVVEAHPELGADKDFVYAAAMLHDIGIRECDAPGIECHGESPYICHGTIGAAMIRSRYGEWGLTAEEAERVARVCERHTGTGLTREAIERQHLPLPSQDLCPETIEEQIVCYADKFFSKTHPDHEKPQERVLRSLEKFGTDCVDTFIRWQEKMG